MEDLGNIIKYIVNKLIFEGFSVGCYCINNCINTYVQKEEYYLKNVISLAALDEVEDKQYYIDYFINSIVEQFNDYFINNDIE